MYPLFAALWVLLAGLAHLAAAEPPLIFPDYTDITLPPNIAPLNFKIQAPGTAYRVEIRSTQGAPISIASAKPAIQIPAKAWRKLLNDNPGQPLYLDITAQTGNGWHSYSTVTNRVARETVDGWLVYRLLTPIFNYYSQLGIYQRDLSTFEQRRILSKESYGEGCLNCHTPFNRQPGTFAFDIRAHQGKHPTILVVSNQPVRLDRTMGYLAWHPSGQMLVFTMNKLSLFLHTQGETRDVYDEASNLGVYFLSSNTLAFPPSIGASGRNETWPTWSPDGKYLYFSSAVPQPLEKSRQIRYDLMRVRFDLKTGQWGEAETVISSAELGLSVCQPKVSPDGRWLMVTMCKQGNFPIFQANSDLYLVEISTGRIRRLEINSDQADSWHSWSGNSRWLVFSSKRLDGLWARPYFSYVDDEGRFSKPFVLPQEDPDFYGFCLNTFNVPELMTGPVEVRESDLVRVIERPEKILKPQTVGIPGGTNAPAVPENYSPSRE